MGRSKAETFIIKGKKYNCYKNGVPYFRKSAMICGKQKDFYGDGEKDAIRQIEEAKNLSRAGLDYDKKTSKVGFVFKYWLFNFKYADKNIKASTFDRYASSFRNHVEPYPISNYVLSKLDSATMQAYVTSLYEEGHLTGANIKCVMKVWKMFCAWAVDEGYVLKNPCRNISLPGERDKVKKVIEVFTQEERDEIVRYMKESDYWFDTLILLAFATGMRQGELLSLKWDDIYDGAIHVQRSTAIVGHVQKDGTIQRYREVWDTKTLNSNRTIPILSDTEEMLRKHKVKQMEYFFVNRLGKPEYVFTSDDGTIIDASNFRKSYQRMLRRAGVPYRKFHAIRHTFATEAIRRGVDVKDLQLLMGHADIETTYIYVQSDDKQKRLAIEKMGSLVSM